MRRHFPDALALVGFVLVTGAALVGQGTQPGQVSAPTTQTPTRAPNAPGTERITGKSIVRGYVVTADTGAPVRRASVNLVLDPRRRGSAVTDAEGRFEVTELPPGRYRVMAQKVGFLSPGMERAGVPRAAPQAVEVGEGQVVEKVVVMLTRGGVISGRITDEFGEALAGAQVSAMRYQYRDGRRQLTPASFNPGTGPFMSTDDLGHFRLYGLPAGEYYVTARPPREFGMPMSDTANAPTEGMAATYYPGSPDAAQARPVQVKAGQELPNIAFALVRQRLSRVRGNALTSRGEPYVGAMVMVSAVDMMGGTGFGGGGDRVRADGSFTVNGVPPGAYNIVVRSGFGGPDDNAEMGTVRVVADGTDIDGVVIAASRGGVLSGRVVSDDGSPLPPLASLTVTAMSLDRGSITFGPSQSSVKDDGSFEIKGLFGVRQVRSGFQPLPEGWSFKAVYSGSNEITDEGIDFSGGRMVDGVQVVLTRKVTTVTGQVTGRDGKPVTDGMVLLFPTDERRWGQMSRFVRITGITGESRFDLRGVPPHDDYRIIALPQLEPGIWTDPEFLRGLLDVSTRVILSEGETKTQDLRQVRLEQ